MLTTAVVPVLSSDNLPLEAEEAMPQPPETDRATLHAAAGTQESATQEDRVACPRCGHVCLVGQLVCPTCYTVFSLQREPSWLTLREG